MKFNIDKLTARLAGRAGWAALPCRDTACRVRSVDMRYSRGFTLIEVMVAMVLLGTAILALLMSNQSFSQTNGAGLKMSTAEFLTEQIREQTVTMTFTTLTGTFTATTKTYSPPHDSQGNTLTTYSGYSQKIKGQYVSATDLHTISGSATSFYKITVEIDLNNEIISSASWLRANY
jgi:prepilin-type N-terminal cleavage/methylation domain-containing protein